MDFARKGQVSFDGAVQLDFLKLLALPTVKKFRMQGKAFVALKPGQETTDIDFDETRDIPPDMIRRVLEEAGKKLVGF